MKSTHIFAFLNTSQGLSLDECVEHFQSSSRLIHGNHVSSLVNSQESKVIDSLEFTVVLPSSVRSLLELSLLGPLEFISPLFTTPTFYNKYIFILNLLNKFISSYFQLQMKS